MAALPESAVAALFASLFPDTPDAVDALQCFREYLRINTAHPQPVYAPAVAFFQRMAERIGLHCSVYEPTPGKPTVVMRWVGRDPSLPALLLNSHSDVVPCEPDKWQWEPFGAQVDADGNIYARGTQDMKCVTIQHLFALMRLKASGWQPLRSIVVTIVPDEEIGGKDGMVAFVESEHFAALQPIAVALDEGLASGAASDEHVVYFGERLPWWVYVRARGPAGHGSRLLEGTAVEKLLAALREFSALRAENVGLLRERQGALDLGEVLSLNITKLHAGADDGQINVVPSEAWASIDIRIPPTIELEPLLQTLRRWAKQHDVELDFVTQEMTHAVTDIGSDEKPSQWWSVLRAIMADKLNVAVRTRIFSASTDSRFLRIAGIPCFGYSPMPRTPVLLHDHNEFLNARTFVDGIANFVTIVRSLADTPAFDAAA